MRRTGQRIGARATVATRKLVIFKSLGRDAVLVCCIKASSVSSAQKVAAARAAPDFTNLRREGSRVIGLEGRNVRTGEPIIVRAKVVVVATGGFNSNIDMVIEHKPELKGHKVLEGSGRGSTGTGHQFVHAAGGYLTHMDHIWFYAYATPDYRDHALSDRPAE